MVLVRLLVLVLIVALVVVHNADYVVLGLVQGFVDVLQLVQLLGAKAALLAKTKEMC